MISNWLTKLIIYSEQTNGSYTLSAMYDICIGTFCSELGFSNQKYIDIASFIKYSDKKIYIKENTLSINYELPKNLHVDLYDLLTNYNYNITDPNESITTPTIIFIDKKFKFDIINKYIRDNIEYGTKEYNLNETFYNNSDNRTDWTHITSFKFKNRLLCKKLWKRNNFGFWYTIWTGNF